MLFGAHLKIRNTEKSTQIPPQDAIDNEDSLQDSEEVSVIERRGESILDLDDTLDEFKDINYDSEDSSLASDSG